MPLLVSEGAAVASSNPGSDLQLATAAITGASLSKRPQPAGVTVRAQRWRRSTSAAALCAAAGGLPSWLQAPAWSRVPPAVQPQLMAATPMGAKQLHAGPRNTITTQSASQLPGGSAACSGSCCHFVPGYPRRRLQAAMSGTAAVAHSQQAAAGLATAAPSLSRRTSGSPAVSALNTSVVARLTASIQQQPSGRLPAVSQLADNGRPDQRTYVTGQL
ncbi:g3626 [Coccomyxa elongata]